MFRKILNITYIIAIIHLIRPLADAERGLEMWFQTKWCVAASGLAAGHIVTKVD
jgi:hypothetical protein